MRIFTLIFSELISVSLVQTNENANEFFMFVSKTTSGTYYLYYKNPLTNKITSRSCRTKLKSEANQFLKDFKLQQVQKSASPKLKLNDAKEIIFGNIKQNNSLNTYRSYLLSFNHLQRIIGNKLISEVNKADIEKYKSVRIKEVKDVSVNIDVRNLKSVFNKLVSSELLEYSKISSAKEFKIENKKFLSIEFDDVLKIMNHIVDIQIQNIIRFSLHTANRISETLKLKVKDIDCSTNIISIYQHKTNRFKYIPITSHLKILLKEILTWEEIKADHYLFHKINMPDIRLRSDYVSRKFKRCIRELGLDEKYKFHCLRHTAITELIKNNVPIAVVKEIAGHRSIATTMLYTHVDIDTMKEGLELLRY